MIQQVAEHTTDQAASKARGESATVTKSKDSSAQVNCNHDENCSKESSAEPSKTAAGPARGLTAFPLKVLAIVGMTCNHACYIFWNQMSDWLFCALFGFGGLTFPIMAFLLVEGYKHTSNVFRYGRRLLVFALVAEIPYWLFLAHQLNVLFTLFVCLALLYAHDHMKSRPLFWCVFVLITLATSVCDWGVLAPIMVLTLHVVQGRRRSVTYSALMPICTSGLPSLATFAASATLRNLAFALYPLVGCTATIPLLCAYNGKRGRSMKWFFYAYYPAHIAVLGLVKGIVFGDWNIAVEM